MKTKNCKNCSLNFKIPDEDLEFLHRISPTFNTKKYEIPSPELCPDCRQQKRIVWRNERSLYNRTCSKSGKKIIAMYPPDAIFPVYDNDIWWSDKWDGKDYARDFDFTRPFFEQIKELRDQVPHFALAVAKTTMENSDYCNHAGYLKNCYLIYNSDYSERCMYGKAMNRCYDCLDCFKIYDCEACYECMNIYNSKFSTWLWDSQNCSECHFSSNLIGCRNCFMCVNLQNQQYCFMNEKLSKDEYEKRVKESKEQNINEDLLQKFLELKAKSPMKWMNEMNTENCSGNYLVNCKNSHECYDCEYLENSKYCYDLKKGDGISYENYDLSSFGVGVVQSYEGGTIGYNANHCLFTENVWECNDVHYSMLCVNNCKNCFGCVGLQKAQYCIFNKQYKQEEYEKTVAKIIEHMQETGEWGQFFPEKISPFGHNETMASEYYPSLESQAKDEKEYQQATEDILACAETGRNFKLQEAEINFYKKMQLPLPKYHPDIRHLHRLKHRLPRKLYKHTCDKCQAEIQTGYSPERPEKVYCEKCYKSEIF